VTSETNTTPAPARETSLESAALAYGKAKAAVDGYQGEKRGVEYAALLSNWRRTTFELNAAASRFARSKETK
jgi:hypothetical protein